MAQVFFISDLHFGHKNVMNFAGKYRHGDNFLENIHYTVELWNHVVSKRDKVYVLGDVCFDEFWLGTLHEMNGVKVLVKGNHDDRVKTETWLKYFDSVEALVSYKGFWLSHPPIHPAELRGKVNIHGHVHQNSILRPFTNEPDDRYINVCMENTGGAPVSLDQIRNGERGWDQWLEYGNNKIKVREPLKG